MCVCVLTSAHAFSNFMRVTKSLFSIHFGFRGLPYMKLAFQWQDGSKIEEKVIVNRLPIYILWKV